MEDAVPDTSSPHNVPRDVAGATPGCLPGLQQNEQFLTSSSQLSISSCIFCSSRPTAQHEQKSCTASSHSYAVEDSALLSHLKSFSYLIFFLPIRSIHTSICKMRDLGAARCCRYSAVSQSSTTRSYLLCRINRKERPTCWTAATVGATSTFWTGLVCWIIFLKGAVGTVIALLVPHFPFPSSWQRVSLEVTRQCPQTGCTLPLRWEEEGWYSTQGKPAARTGSTAGLRRDKIKKRTEKWKGK